MRAVEGGAGFDAPLTLAEVRDWQQRIRSGAHLMREPERARTLRWLDEEEVRLSAQQRDGADG